MTNEEIQEKLQRLNTDEGLQNLIAQANARSILLHTQENKENFPPFTITDEKLDILALQYLNIGCQFAENSNLESARHPLEIGANILEYVHSSNYNQRENSSYYGLIAALAYYASFQYSKSYILIGKIQVNTPIGELTALFLKRDFFNLKNLILSIVVDESYSDNNLAEAFEDEASENKIYEITIAKALNFFLLYLFYGNEDDLLKAKRDLEALRDIAELKQDPGIWWVIRLLLIITGGIQEASLWNVLSRFFDMDNKKVSSYIHSLIYSYPRGIYEFFITQRKSIDSVINGDENGVVISIPTSSGKTRIAEIAILDCLSNNTDAKVLYIAPFRSLAFEVETSLSNILRHEEISVSHLYGGALFSKLDENILSDSNVIIVTPEKAKAILRGNDEILSQIKLVIIDEGHLLGATRRLIANEVYYEEIRHYVEANNGKFLLLSAVLPNAEEIAKWLTGNNENVYKDSWRPSDERFGILAWNGKRVNLEWKSSDVERNSFNSSFIVQRTIPKTGRQIKDRVFPNDRNDAVAATAYKLRIFGPVLIFVGRKDSVFVMARSYLNCLEAGDRVDIDWQNNDWTAYELACTEMYGADNEWLRFAKKGILCHNADLHSDVRLPLERLMRSSKPRVIICTSTLGQGVNLGVSTVIFSTLMQAGSSISKRDFWNIAGRAGRAFVDNEGKVLVALSTNDTPSRVRRTRTSIAEYLDRENMDLATSGLLYSISRLIAIANNEGINFEHFLEIVAENNINSLGDEASYFESMLGWIDDTLLSLHSINNPEEQEVSNDWIDTHFRKSLSYIQAESAPKTAEQVLAFVKARVDGISKKVGSDRGFWKSIIKSGIPLNSDLLIEERMQNITDYIDEYMVEDLLGSESSLNNLITLSKKIEELLNDLPVLLDEGADIISRDIDTIRNHWFNGVSMSKIIDFEKAESVITKLYSFILPWLFNGISKKFKLREQEDYANIMEKLAILCEAGLPRIETVKIYQSGIRSRASAVEVSNLYGDSEMTIRDYRRELIENKDAIQNNVSDIAQQWLELLTNSSDKKRVVIRKIENFELNVGQNHGDILIAKNVNNKQYLVSDDYQKIYEVNIGIDFNQVNDVFGVYFQFSQRIGKWQMKVENPNVHLA